MSRAYWPLEAWGDQKKGGCLERVGIWVLGVGRKRVGVSSVWRPGARGEAPGEAPRSCFREPLTWTAKKIKILGQKIIDLLSICSLVMTGREVAYPTPAPTSDFTLPTASELFGR